jgi:phosphoribosylglycinamide formyltransferase 1
MITLTVFISGNGSTLQNLINKIKEEDLDAKIKLVISNNHQAPGLIKAKKANIPCITIPYKSTNQFSNKAFRRCNSDLVLLAGFLKLIKVPQKFKDRILNIHPSLIPKFCGKGMYGTRVHEAVIKAKEKVSGCTVHVVDDKYDHGTILLQRKVHVLENDTPETLAKRVFEQECIAYPEAITLFA